MKRDRRNVENENTAQIHFPISAVKQFAFAQPTVVDIPSFTFCSAPLEKLRGKAWLSRLLLRAQEEMGSADVLKPQTTLALALFDKRAGHECSMARSSPSMLLSASSTSSLSEMLPPTYVIAGFAAASPIFVGGDQTYCGVQLVWVSRTYRRKGLASGLIEVLRRNTVYGVTFPPSRCAFSRPTNDGKLFAISYTGGTNFAIW